MKTVTFKDKDGLMELTVREEFTQKNPNYLDMDIGQLVTAHFNKYLHNEMGPAVHYVGFPEIVMDKIHEQNPDAVIDSKTYWIDGKMLRGLELQDFLGKIRTR